MYGFRRGSEGGMGVWVDFLVGVWFRLVVEELAVVVVILGLV
jgi:hypothetical protein